MVHPRDKDDPLALSDLQKSKDEGTLGEFRFLLTHAEMSDLQDQWAAGLTTLGEHGVRPARPPPAARQGPRRRALLRAARRRRHGQRRRPLEGALQPRVPGRVRRVAARLPADAPARARGGAAAHDRPLGRRHLLLGRAAERRLVHDELHAHVRQVAARLPRGVPARRRRRRSCRPASCASTGARNAARFEKTTASRRISVPLIESADAQGAPR